MSTKQFVYENGLLPADVIVLRKKVFGMVDHFAIYLGINVFGKPQFVANFTNGVQIIPDEKIDEQLETYIPERIEKFEGNHYQRELVIRRARSKIGERAYNYITNNCEHYKNLVLYGRAYSTQVNTTGNVLMAGGGFLLAKGLVNSNNKSRNWGVGLLLLGIILKYYADR